MMMIMVHNEVNEMRESYETHIQDSKKYSEYSKKNLRIE